MSRLHLNTQTLVERWEDRRDIKNMMGKYVNSLLLKREPVMLEEYWSTAEDISLGLNNGYYIGPAALKDYYGSIDKQTKAVAAAMKKAFPVDLEGLSDEELYGTGPLELKSIDNAVIEVADDGITGKGFFYCFGLETVVDEHGPYSKWVLGSYAADFIYEDERWKFWHMLYLEDINEVAGQRWGVNSPCPYPEQPDFAGLKNIGSEKPSRPVVLRERYTGERSFTRLPKLPEPYDTFINTFSYGADSKEAFV